MNDLLSFLNKIFYYIKSFRLYEPLFISSLIISAFIASIVTPLLQKSVSTVLGISNVIPVLSSEIITVVFWLYLSSTLRNILISIDNLVLKLISQISPKYSIDFTKHSSTEKFSNEWITQGNLYFENGLIITDTHSGVLLKPYFLWLGRIWLNFEAKLNIVFNNKISLDTIQDSNSGEWITTEKNKLRLLFGIIIRAQSLDDYYMLEIWKIDNYIFLKPHVRISGVWRAPIYTSPVNLKINKHQNRIKLRLVVNKRVANIFVGNGKNPLTWILPSEYEIDPGKQDIELRDGFVRKISFANRAGMFGFRNYGNEIATVQKLEIIPAK